MDRQQQNRTDQCNPNNPQTGAGHNKGYHGEATKADLDNHGKQLNPNNTNCQPKK